MLYDPKWGKKKASELTFADLVAWVETQPRDGSYDYTSCDHCLVGQFITAMTGTKEPGGELIYSTLFPGNGYDTVAAQKPWTFGAALDRARKLAAA